MSEAPSTLSAPPATGAAADESGPTTPSERPPFFIVGCGRSGTSLLRSMLNSHPSISVPPEALSLIDFLRARRGGIDAIRRAMLRDHEIREWGVPLEESRLRDCRSVPELIELVHRLYAERGGKARWGHKTPRFVRFTDVLLRAFPGALFIHVVRDPRAVASSFIRSPVHRSNALYAARRWVRDVSCARRLARAHPERTLEVRYEELVGDAEGALRRVCAFLGEPFDADMLEYHRTGGRELTTYHRDAHARLASAPDPARIDAWRRDLGARGIAIVEHVAGDLLERCGYERIGAPPPPGGALLACRLQRSVGLVRQAMFSLRARGGFLPGFVARKVRLGLAGDLFDVNA